MCPYYIIRGKTDPCKPNDCGMIAAGFGLSVLQAEI